MVQDFLKNISTPIQHLGDVHGIELWIKRDDLIDPHVSGNKLYKLKYHIKKAQRLQKEAVLTFGGAYSNHLAATAAYCKAIGLGSIGFVRGERTEPLNPCLSFCSSQGMDLHFISRTEYKLKSDSNWLTDLQERFSKAYIIPEGGAGTEGIKGAAEIIDERCSDFDAIICAVGTGTTLAGLLRSANPNQRIIGIPIHKHTNIMEEVLNNIPNNLLIWDQYHFKGYAKWSDELINFIQRFYHHHKIKLDPIYTGKAMFGLLEKIENGTFQPGKKVLFIHTGGLQGIEGFELRHQLRLFDH